MFAAGSSGPVVKNPPANAGDMGLIPGQGTNIPSACHNLRSLSQRSCAVPPIPRKKFFLLYSGEQENGKLPEDLPQVNFSGGSPF